MAVNAETKPVEDLGHRVDDTISVGEDLDFQERWWRFENAVWWIFALLLVLDLLGLFGRGWLANAYVKTDDGTLQVKYERIERTMTPSTLTVNFGPQALDHGRYRLFASANVVQVLGNSRIAPQPLSSEVGDGGYTYTFPANGSNAAVNFSLEPSAPGVYHFILGVPGGQKIDRRVVVVP